MGQHNCDQCEKVCNSQFNLNRHKQYIHEKEIEEWKECIKCSELLRTETDFYIKNKLINKSPYTNICKKCCIKSVNSDIIDCPICGKKTYFRNLKRHQTTIQCEKLKRMM